MTRTPPLHRLPVFVFLALLAAPLSARAAGSSDEDVTVGVPTPPEVIEHIIEAGMHDSQVMETLDELVNGIGARLTSSTNLRKAEQWSVEQFEALGLRTELHQWGESPVGFDRGPSSGGVVAPVDMPLQFYTRSWSAGTDGAVRGPAVLAPRDAAELEARRAGFARAWILTPSDWPPAPRGDQVPEDVAEEDRAEWVRTARRDHREFTRLRAEAYEQEGAAGRVRPSPAGELLIMSGNSNIAWHDLPDDVLVTVLASEFDALMELYDSEEPLELEFDIENRFVEGPIPQHNVVADLVGELYPDEYVIVGGHLDTWDIAPGANDNGTGVSTTIEAARLLVGAGARPDRTIRFILWGGEEQGLHGSRSWVAEHDELMEHISAVLIHDGGTNALSGLDITKAMREQMDAALAPVFAFSETVEGAEPFAVRVVPGLVPGASDHNPFLAEGVPGFFWRQSGRAEYSYTHHTQHDHYDAAIPEYQRHSSVVVALTALGLANLPEKLSRRALMRPRRTLGVFLSGHTVTGVSQNSQASRLGVEEGDVFIAMNGESLEGKSLTNERDSGEGHKLIEWKRGEEVHSGLFLWDRGELEHDPEEFELTTSDDVTVRGDYYMGKVDAPASGSALVLLHMNRANRHDWLPLRDELYEAGIATVALDMRGHGESVDAAGALAARVQASDPTLYAGMPHDVEAVLGWLERRGYERARIGLMGGSVGASVALRVASQDQALPGAVLLTPGTNYLGVDSVADVARWDGRPLALVSSEEEADKGARPLFDAMRADDPWTRAQLVILDGTGIHGTRMFGDVEGIEQRLADWWVDVLATVDR